MFKALAIGLVLAALPQPPSTVVIRRAAVGGGDFCDGSGPTDAYGTAVLFCQDFEPTAACDAGTPDGDTVNGSPNCQNSTSPLDGTYSLTATANDAEDSVDYTDDFSTTADSLCLFVTLRVLSDAGSANNRWLAHLYNSADASVALLQYRGSDNSVQGEPGYGSGETTSNDILANIDTTTYVACLRVETDATPQVKLFVDPEDDYDCGGTTVSVGTSAAGPNDASTIDRLVLHPDCWEGGGTTDDFCAAKIDNVIVKTCTF